MLLLKYCMYTVLILYISSCSSTQKITRAIYPEHSFVGWQFSNKNMLDFDIPLHMQEDRENRLKSGFYAILIDKEKSYDTSEHIIIIIYQKKDQNFQAFDSVSNYAKYSMRLFLHQYPQGKIVEWHPQNNFLSGGASYESYDAANQVAPSRAIFIDAGDGYYVVSLHAKTRVQLNNKGFNDFIASLKFIPIK